MVLCIQNSAFWIRITSLYGSQTWPLICEFKTAFLDPEWRLSNGLSLHLWFSAFETATLRPEYSCISVPALICGFCMQNCDFRTRNASLYWSQTSPVILWTQNSVINCRITSLHGSQTSPVVLCMQNNVNSFRITSLHVTQPSFVVFACKTSTLGPELQFSIGHRPHPCFFWIENSDFRTRSASLYWFQTSPVILWMQNSVISTRGTSLHGSQTSPVVLCIQNNVIGIRITSLHGSQPSFVVFECKTAPLAPELQVSMDPSPHLWFLQAKLRLFDQNHKSLWVPDFACWFVIAKQHA